MLDGFISWKHAANQDDNIHPFLCPAYPKSKHSTLALSHQGGINLSSYIQNLSKIRQQHSSSLPVSHNIATLIFIMMNEKKGEGNIKVFCRFRPFNSKELAAHPEKVHRINNHSQLIIRDPKNQKGSGMSFMYDHCFDMDSTQEEVFDKVGGPVLNNILEGFHGTIMAYGQTSSGKTHTMQGYDLSEKQNRGIMPRMIERLFAAIEKSPESVEFKLKISIFELYMEKVRDLLDVSKSDLRIREARQGSYIENLTEVYISDKHQLFRIITIGQKNRITCATNMNEHSSRSHLIFLLSVNQLTMPQGTSKTSKLFLIDLAGSQKISKTGAEGKVLQEAKKINLSLTNLGKVIKSLSEKGGHVPYRDSKLTRILKDSLGGNSKTTLIVTCSPHEMHIAESISTLRFGENAQKVKNKPKINRELTVQQLQKMIEKLQGEAVIRERRIRVLQEYIVGTLKADLPADTLQLKKQLKKEGQENELSMSMTSELQRQEQEANKLSISYIAEQAQMRIMSLQEQLKNNNARMQQQMDNYYKLKKEYHDLHDHLTSILKQNIQLKEELQDKQRKSLLSDKSIQSNAHLIRLILGEITTILGPSMEKQLIEDIQNSHWYRKIMIEGQSCSQYWQLEKDQMNRQLEELMNETRQPEADNGKKRQQMRVQKDNEKIIELEEKLGHVFEQYNAMMNQLTHWKAQCQLYERNLRKKEEAIHKLQKQVDEMSEQIEEMYLYDDGGSHFDDAVSVRSNRIVKPLKGGFIIR